MNVDETTLLAQLRWIRIKNGRKNEPKDDLLYEKSYQRTIRLNPLKLSAQNTKVLIDFLIIIKKLSSHPS